MIAVSDRYVSQKREEHIHYAATLDALSPLKVLSRGYSVVRNAQGGSIKNAEQVEVGDLIRITLNDGELGCRVEDKVVEYGKETYL